MFQKDKGSLINDKSSLKGFQFDNSAKKIDRLSSPVMYTPKLEHLRSKTNQYIFTEELEIDQFPLSTSKNENSIKPFDKQFQIHLYKQKNHPSSAIEEHQEQQEIQLRQRILPYTMRTRAGQLSQNIQQNNQDSVFVITSFMGDRNSTLLGVCDGHGELGHNVSNFVKKNLFKIIHNNINVEGGLASNESLNMEQVFQKSFSQLTNQLKESQLEGINSGTTANCILVKSNQLWCANCGDSRSILIQIIQNQWIVFALSQDHQPELESERRRIIDAGGIIAYSKDKQYGPLRVWDQQMEVPGLSMTRSIGDFAGEIAGIISEPDVEYVTLFEEDQLLVLASDGVWEYLSNEQDKQNIQSNSYVFQVANTIKPFFQDRDGDGAADAVINQASSAWKQVGQQNEKNLYIEKISFLQRNPNGEVDDISVIILFLDID